VSSYIPLIIDYNPVDPEEIPGYLSTINLETFSGSHYEIGIQQGKATRELIHRALGTNSKL